MITLEALRMLDTTVWLRSGEQASKRLHCSQSTVSRNNAETTELLGLEWNRIDGELQLQGNTTLLQMERRVHQHKRLLCEEGGIPLRVEVNFWAAPTLLNPLPPGWEGGAWDHVGMARPMQLVRERVIDAWIASYQPDLPDQDSDLCVIDLVVSPVYLVAAEGHPLMGRSNLKAQDLDPFPSLALPVGLFPKTETILRAQGLWQTRVRMKRFRPALWQGRSEDAVTLSYATSLGLTVMPNLKPLDYDLGLTSAESLVVRLEVLEQPAIQALLSILRHRCELLVEQFPDLKIAENHH